MKSFWAILSCCILLGGFNFAGAFAGETEVFAAANKAFHEGKWEEALASYQTLPKTFAVLYNMGSTYFKQGQLGKAIYYFKWALQESPRDPDARFNLKYVRSKTGAAELGRPWYSYLALPLSLAEIWWIAGGILFILAVGLSWGRRGVLWILILAIPLLAQFGQARDFGQTAIAGQEVKVYSSPSAEGILLFTLPEGSEVSLAGHTAAAAENWTVVELGPQKKGWALRNQLIADAGPQQH